MDLPYIRIRGFLRRHAGKARGAWKAAVAAILLGCGPEGDGPVGISIFALKNSTPDSIFAIFKTQASQDTTPAVGPGDSLDFFENSGFGSNPLPSKSLLFLEIHRHRDGGVIVRSEPVIDPDWTSVKLDRLEYGRIRYTFDLMRP